MHDYQKEILYWEIKVATYSITTVCADKKMPTLTQELVLVILEKADFVPFCTQETSTSLLGNNTRGNVNVIIELSIGDCSSTPIISNQSCSKQDL